MRNWKLYLFLLFAGMNFSAIKADSVNPLWLRHCAISPDGSTIAFAYMGDIYTVPVGGGTARQLTSYNGYDNYPVWSPDGSQLAFASDRDGSLDVYLVAATGGIPKRLTTNSGAEIPCMFSDAQHVVYRSTGTPTTEDFQFPSGQFYHLYKVALQQGSRPELYSELPMDAPSIGKNGEILYTDVKGYEDPWRKHERSSISRDIWLYDGTSYSKLTDFIGEDRNAVWAADENSFYYLSEQNGTSNVYKRALTAGSVASQMTDYKDNPVRFLTISNNGILCYSYNGQIYTLKDGEQPHLVAVSITADNYSRDVVRTLRSSGASDLALSPKNKEIAFVMNGDVYVTSLDYKTTKQVTQTPEVERNVDFAPDGRSLVYASERGGLWQVYQTSIVNDKEKNFTYSTDLKEENLTNCKETCFQPLYSPDGKKVAFLRNRTELCVLDLKSKKIVTARDGKFAYSYSDGDQNFSWSPNSQWLLTNYIGHGGWNNPDVAVVKADGSELHNLTNSGYSEGNAKWALDGKAMIFDSDRAGYRSHGSWGAESDAYIMFFDVAAYEKFRMTKEELALLDEKEKAEKGLEKKDDKSDDKIAKKAKKVEKELKKDSVKAVMDFKLDLENLDDRTVKLTPYSTNMGDMILSKTGDKLYFVAPYGGASALWEQNLKEGATTLKARNVSGGSLIADSDVKNLYYVSGGGIKKLDLGDGSIKDVAFESFVDTPPYQVKAKEIFEHIWNQEKDKLFDPKMNGADWPAIHANYARFIPYINNGYDLSEMCSEMLGELNVSHTGCRYYPATTALRTASLGLFFDEKYTGDGLKIKEIMDKSPLNTMKTDVTPGCIIEKIDGDTIKANTDYYPLLAGKSDRPTRLTINKNGKRFDVTVKPITAGEESSLLYDRWVKRNEKMVYDLSKGRVAYVHIKSMDGDSYHTLYQKLLNDSNRNKDAVIVDTRHNGGGWLHDDVCILLSGTKYISYEPRGQYVGPDPFNRWTKPSCMMICEDNYSNAHGTPWFYKEMGIGKLIGAPVPGTMTAVWWERIGDGDFVYGIPQVTSVDRRGGILENNQLEPDILIYNTPGEVLTGKDKQLERAVNEMLSITKK
jgi:tricorn protease